MARHFAALLFLAGLSHGQAQALTWDQNTAGEIVGRPPETPAELLDFCVANPERCSISIDHRSGGWQRHLQADRLNPVASTYKVVTLLDYAERIADGRIRDTHRVLRDDWTRFWIGADGEELTRTLTGPIEDAAGNHYRIRRSGGRSHKGALRQSWEHLDRPARVSVDELAQVMIRFSDNAAADWFRHQFGERSLERVVNRFVGGYHDIPPAINAMFLGYFLNPDRPGRPSVGERTLSDYSGYAAYGFRDETARWFARLEDRDFVARARSCQPAVLPWAPRFGACSPSIGEPGESQMRKLLERYTPRSNTRTQTRLMAHLLDRDLMPAAAHAAAERALEFRLDPSRFRDPRFRNRYRRYAAKSGSFRTNRGLAVLAWTAYLESQPQASGAISAGTVTVHLFDLPGGGRQATTGSLVPDLEFELPLRFAEDVIADRGGLAAAIMRRLPVDEARPELVARIERLEARVLPGGVARTLSLEARVRNIGTVASPAATELALFLRRSPGIPGRDASVPADATLAVPPLAADESVALLFELPVPAGRDFVSLVTDPENRIAESSESGESVGSTAHRDGHWERLRFARINYRSIGVRRDGLAAGNGVDWSATATAGSAEVRLQGRGALSPEIGRGDRLVLAPGQANETVAHLADRDGADRLRLQQPLARSLTGAAFVIERAFHDIQSWEDARQGDLAAERRIEVGVLYDDGPFHCRPAAESGCRRDGGRPTAMATIDGSVTTAAHYMALEAARGRHHRARRDAGVVLDGEGEVATGIRILDHHTRVAGLEMRGFAGIPGAAAITVEGARGVLLADMLIHDFDGGEHSATAILGRRLAGFTLRNSIIHGPGGAGVRLNHPTASGAVENCTVYAMSGTGIEEGDGLLDVRNTISMGNGEADFRVRRGLQDHNLSSDESAAGRGSMTGRSAEREFRSASLASPDLHLGTQAEAAGSGVVLSPSFRADIDGEPRPTGNTERWSRGADEVDR
ncbi:MAG: CARDB domain-containing protein [Gammaproteobacteria bacterium]|nr:CARDB domain-containing protein [Gammaproteobacteria bacterium]